jgi:hypothetical protein
MPFATLFVSVWAWMPLPEWLTGCELRPKLKPSLLSKTKGAEVGVVGAGTREGRAGVSREDAVTEDPLESSFPSVQLPSRRRTSHASPTAGPSRLRRPSTRCFSSSTSRRARPVTWLKAGANALNPPGRSALATLSRSKLGTPTVNLRMSSGLCTYVDFFVFVCV